MARIPSFVLNDKRAIPAAAFGTATGHSGLDDTSYVLRAIEGGFTHIDTAQAYGNEDSVGEALRQVFRKQDAGNEKGDIESQLIGAVARENIWVTTKYNGKINDAEEALDASLKRLGIPSVDLYLIHTPRVTPDILKTWSELELAHAHGKAKSIGVSNFSVEHLELILKHGSVPPAVNQIAFNPYTYHEIKDTLQFCQEHGIQVESYGGLWPLSVLPKGKLNNVITDIAQRLGPKVTPAQVLLSWIYAKGVVLIMTSSNSAHIQECLEIFELPSLAEEDIFAIEEAGKSSPTADRSLAHEMHKRVASTILVTLLGSIVLFKIVSML